MQVSLLAVSPSERQAGMDQANAIFDAITDATALARLVDERVQENLYLEFKTKKDSRTPELDKSDSFQFSRALSGFANSDGGVLVWGVETDRHERARATKPIAQVVEFAAGGGFSGMAAAVVVQSRYRAIDENAGPDLSLIHI